MSSYRYVVFGTDTYDTSKSYAANLMVLEKKDIIPAGEYVGLKLPASTKKDELAKRLSEYVLSHPKEMVEKMNDEEVLLVKEILDAGANAITWKRHLLKYYTLKSLVWVVVNRKGNKDGFAMVDELREAFAPYINERIERAKESVAVAKEKKKKSSTAEFGLRNLKSILNKLDERHQDLVQYLFMVNKIDYEIYEFRDEWMIDGYASCYNAYFHHDDKRVIATLNDYVYDIMKEWKADAPSLYRESMNDLKFWINYTLPDFTPSLKEDIDKQWSIGIKTDTADGLAASLLPFPIQIIDMIREKKYQEAAGNLYYIFTLLGQANRKKEKWLEASRDNVGTFNDLDRMCELLRFLYCHIRQLDDLNSKLKNEMDIHFSILNMRSGLFGYGDFFGDSRATDMISDKDEQLSDYFDIEGESIIADWYKKKLTDNKL